MLEIPKDREIIMSEDYRLILRLAAERNVNLALLSLVFSAGHPHGRVLDQLACGIINHENMPSRSYPLSESHSALTDKRPAAHTIPYKLNHIDARLFDLRKREFLCMSEHRSLLVGDIPTEIRRQTIEFYRCGNL